MPDITFVIPTHNRPILVESAIQSVLNQTHDDWELIVVDDGSIPPLADSLRISDPRLHIHRHEQARGVAAARNTGASLASAPVIAFLDDDDTLDPRYADVILNRFREATSPPAMCWPALREIEAASGRQRVIQDMPCKIEAGAGSATSFVATAYARTTGMAFLTHRFREAGGFDETLAVSEDRELVFRLLAAGNSCCSVSEALVNFYVHSGPRLSTSDNRKRQAECDTRILDRHRVFLLKHPKLASRFLNLVAARQRRAGMTADYRRTLLMLLSVRPFDLRAIRRLLVSYLKP